MKRFAVTALVLAAFAANSMAQGFGLQIAETAGPQKEGVARATGGITLGSDEAFIGGRFSYGIIDGLLGFGDIGWVHVKDLDGGPGIQVGGLFSLPLQQLPFNLGVRGTVYKPFVDSRVSIVGASLWGIASMPVNLDLAPLRTAKKGQAQKGLSVYGGVGIDHVRWTYDGDEFSGGDHGDTQLGFSVGAVMYVSDQLSFYGELSYVDDPFVGGGVRLDF
jgi:hypothetical protein